MILLPLIRHDPGWYAPGVRHTMASRFDIDPEDLPLLYLDELEPDDPGATKNTNLLDPDATQHVVESVKYSPAIGVHYRPTSHSGPDVTDMDHLREDPHSILGDDTNPEPDDDLTDVSSILEYYNETALTSKGRKSIDSSEFGLPRTRQYPLNDEQHIRQAVRMFGHCKDPSDRKILASNIFKKAEEHGVELNIGKKNPLYEYIPKKLQESSDLEPKEDEILSVFGFEKPMDKRTKYDIVHEHMRRNQNYYNLVFYSDDFLKAVKQLNEFKFFDYFYPNFRTHNFYQRMQFSCGGLAVDRDVYRMLGLRYPLETDFTIPLGEYRPVDQETFQMYLDSTYSELSNWFRVGKDDIGHIIYCLRLYSVLGAIMNDPNFSMELLSAQHQGLLLDWLQHVQYEYDLLRDEPEESPVYLQQMQQLFDLGWNYTENPRDTETIVANVVSMCDNMAMAKDLVVSINENTEFLDKTDCAGYLIKELNLDDDLFLIPSMLEFPVISKGSVRMAMDKIERIEREYPDSLKEYVANLNRKYRELGCTFSISVDHPYAKYASKDIVDHMTMILMEGDTAVKDHGTSSGRTSPVEQGPWYIDNDTNDAVGQNLLDNKELGPNDKAKPPLDYTRHYSVT